MKDVRRLPADDQRPRPFTELSDAGLLWLINRVVFHPRGLALALHADERGEFVGWSLEGDGSEVWTFSAEDDDEQFERVRRTLSEAVE